jgi:nicotinate-nucleotide pyrophosphorylase (carboxylating)
MNDLPRALIREALDEDLGGVGDLSARYFVDEGAKGKARLVAREAGVLCGGEIAAEVFRSVDPGLEVRVGLPDGWELGAGDVVLEVEGRMRSLLTGERTALNFLGRLSGVASLTARYVAAAGGQCAVLDTRKTTPGWRRLEKMAVRAGGGENHRMGLYDMVMVKDNHLLAEGCEEGLAGAIGRLRADHGGVRVEVEADELGQVERFLRVAGVDIILLDNMGLAELRAAVALRDRLAPGVLLEASGGVSLETVGAIAATGVERISVGALTHSARCLDFSMECLRSGE